MIWIDIDNGRDLRKTHSGSQDDEDDAKQGDEHEPNNLKAPKRMTGRSWQTKAAKYQHTSAEMKHHPAPRTPHHYEYYT